MLNIRNTNSLVDSTSNCKELGFSGSDIISYTSVQNNSQGVGIVKSIDSDIVEIMYMILNIMSLGMKEELV